MVRGAGSGLIAVITSTITVTAAKVIIMRIRKCTSKALHRVPPQVTCSNP